MTRAHLHGGHVEFYREVAYFPISRNIALSVAFDRFALRYCLGVGTSLTSEMSAKSARTSETSNSKYCIFEEISTQFRLYAHSWGRKYPPIIPIIIRPSPFALADVKIALSETNRIV